MNKKNSLMIMPDEQQVQDMTLICKKMIVGGTVLNDRQATALAVAAISMDLSPLNGEMYFIPGSGPYVGVKGLRRNTQNKLAKKSQSATYQLSERYEDPVKFGGMAGDMCVVIEYRDNWRSDAWFKQAEQFKKIFGDAITGEQTDLLLQVIGKPPVITGIGIVGADYQKEYAMMPEKFKKGNRSPFRIARERAEKDALNQAWPVGEIASIDFGSDIEQPEISIDGKPLQLDPADLDDGAVEAEFKPADVAQKSPEDLSDELGFDGQAAQAPAAKVAAVQKKAEADAVKAHAADPVEPITFDDLYAELNFASTQNATDNKKTSKNMGGILISAMEQELAKISPAAGNLKQAQRRMMRKAVEFILLGNNKLEGHERLALFARWKPFKVPNTEKPIQYSMCVQGLIELSVGWLEFLKFDHQQRLTFYKSQADMDLIEQNILEDNND